VVLNQRLLGERPKFLRYTSAVCSMMLWGTELHHNAPQFVLDRNDQRKATTIRSCRSSGNMSEKKSGGRLAASRNAQA